MENEISRRILDAVINKNLNKIADEIRKGEYINTTDYWNKHLTGKKYFLVGDSADCNDYLEAMGLNSLEVFFCDSELEAEKDKQSNIKDGVRERNIEIVLLNQIN